MKKIFYLMLVALTVGMFTACDDDDENTPQINNPEPKEQWGKTLRGDNQTLLAFPDIYADYWEYTYSYKDNPNIGLRLTGKFPKSRFFNFTVYNDETQIDVSSIEDVNIQPDDSSINPYVKETDDYGANGYTYVSSRRMSIWSPFSCVFTWRNNIAAMSMAAWTCLLSKLST